jgi:hypothetical protein
MPFIPGQSGNPLGRAKKIDYRSQELQVFFQEHRQDIKKIGEIAIKHALVNEEAWAVKLCMEHFYPKPGTTVAISKEETKEVNVNVSNFADSLSFEDKQAFLKMWLKSKRGVPAFNTTIDSEENVASETSEQ